MSEHNPLAAQRRKARHYGLQALYQWTLSGASPSDIEAEFRVDNDFQHTDGEYFNALLCGVIPPSLQLMLFALAAAAAAWLMLRGRKIPEGAPSRDGRVQLLVQGLGVGLLTGIAGVGGGFAIVPALVLLARLPMTQASGTSLLVICAS